jgi:hypothetical protein
VPPFVGRVQLVQRRNILGARVRGRMHAFERLLRLPRLPDSLFW